MGYNMAGNVRRKMSPTGTLFIHDVVRSACEKFKEEFGELGPVEIIDTAKAGVDQSETLITVVPRGVNVQEIYLQGSGAVINATKKPQRLIFECSTIDVKTTREVGEKVRQAGIGRYFDSPVSVSLAFLP